MTGQDLFEQVIPRLQGPAQCSVLEAIREVQGIIVNRLLWRRSEIVKKPGSVTVTAGNNSVGLPSDYVALEARPYTSERTLTPVDQALTRPATTAGTSQYFEVTGRTLTVFPPTLTSLAVTLPYYFRPAILTDLATTLPFSGEFDDVFIEGVLGVLGKGLTVVADKGFVAVIAAQVDTYLDTKARMDEQLVADDINGVY